LEDLKATYSAWGANVDREKSGHSIISTSLENVEFPETVVSVVNYLQEKRALDFD
jgi:hypothetical protein